MFRMLSLDIARPTPTEMEVDDESSRRRKRGEVDSDACDRDRHRRRGEGSSSGSTSVAACGKRKAAASSSDDGDGEVDNTPVQLPKRRRMLASTRQYHSLPPGFGVTTPSEPPPPLPVSRPHRARAVATAFSKVRRRIGKTTRHRQLPRFLLPQAIPPGP